MKIRTRNLLHFDVSWIHSTKRAFSIFFSSGLANYQMVALILWRVQQMLNLLKWIRNCMNVLHGKSIITMTIWTAECDHIVPVSGSEYAGLFCNGMILIVLFLLLAISLLIYIRRWCGIHKCIPLSLSHTRGLFIWWIHLLNYTIITLTNDLSLTIFKADIAWLWYIYGLVCTLLYHDKCSMIYFVSIDKYFIVLVALQ